MLKVAYTSKGAWPIAHTGSLQKALHNQALRRYGFVLPSDLAAQSSPPGPTARKTVRTVVWEGGRALSAAASSLGDEA